MGGQIEAYKYRLIILEPVNNEKNIKLLDRVRKTAAYLSNTPKEIYIENLKPPVLKEIAGVAKRERMAGEIFMYGNGLTTDLNNPGFLLLVDINNKWEEVTKSNFKRLIKMIADK